MVAVASPNPPVTEPWQVGFLRLVPQIQRRASWLLRRWPSQERDEAIAEITADATLAFARLAQQGREHVATAGSLVGFALRHLRAGRRVGCRSNVRDLTSPYAQRRHPHRIGRLDRFDDSTGAWREIVVEDRTLRAGGDSGCQVGHCGLVAVTAPRTSARRSVIGSGRTDQPGCPAHRGLAESRLAAPQAVRDVVASLPGIAKRDIGLMRRPLRSPDCRCAGRHSRQSGLESSLPATSSTDTQKFFATDMRRKRLTGAAPRCHLGRMTASTSRRYRRRFDDRPQDRDPNTIWLGDGEGYLVAEGGHYWWVEDRLSVRRGPEVLVQARLLNIGQRVDWGRLVTSTTPGWRALHREVLADPGLLTHFPRWPRKFEEFVAGAYAHARWRDVILSPRTGDGGFDVAAYKGGRQVLDELKAFKPSLRVGHQIVRAALGLLIQHRDFVDQVRVTTTSTFATRILQAFAHQLHQELKLRDRVALLRWLSSMRPAA